MIDTSDLNAKLYFTKGYEAGVEIERERAIRLATFLSETQESGKGETRDIVFLSDFLDYIRDEENK
jgi:hypothetical protein